MPRRIVVTGGAGFLGANLRVRLGEAGYTDVVSVVRDTDAEACRAALAAADFVFHLAGVNRPANLADFATGNTGFTQTVIDALHSSGRAVPVAFASSTQVTLDNPYGRSKLATEEVLRDYAEQSGAAVHVLRLTNVFGKWARPNYNSAVATFCYNTARGLPITVHDAAASLHLLYIDDAVNAMLALLETSAERYQISEPGPVYATTVGEVADIIRSFPDSRLSLVVPPAGAGLYRALYATYLSYLAPRQFSYALTPHRDARGSFAEMLKTPTHGQISYFTAGPGITRGEHYHHTKNEKFLVVRGTAHFGFRHVLTGERYEEIVSGEQPRVVETVPGWAHNLTNIGNDELVVMLWANEIFDPQAPDTIACQVA